VLTVPSWHSTVESELRRIDPNGVETGIQRHETGILTFGWIMPAG
jgi:hypothetical protein